MPEHSEEVQEVATPSLLKRTIKPITAWHDWLERWKDAKDLQIMEGLLHCGFSVVFDQYVYQKKDYDRIDRLAFYLAIADGCADENLLRLPEEDWHPNCFMGYDKDGNRIFRTESQVRQQLAKKAFDMLCLNFLRIGCVKKPQRGGDFSFWQDTIFSERLFPIIQSFFRVEENRWKTSLVLRNISSFSERSHNEKLAIDFLLNLASALWMFEDDSLEPWDESRKEVRKAEIAALRSRIEAAKPWMVEVLSFLGEIDLLREWLFRLDEPCLAKLKELALRNCFRKGSHPVSEDRAVATIEEACYLGSKSAWLLKEHELKLREHQRLTAIRDAERRQAEAQREVERLRQN